MDTKPHSSRVARRLSPPPAPKELVVIAHDIRSLYNVGSLFRLADGVGVTKLYLTGLTGAPHNRLKYQRQRQQIAKTALEGLEAVDWEHHADPLPIIQSLKEQGVTIVGLELTPTSHDLITQDLSGSICLILGNETEGLADHLQQACDLIVHLPMFGQGKSLNVVTATATALYQIKYQQQASTPKSLDS